MQGPDFIFFLQDKQRRFWGIAPDGSVTRSNQPYPLVYSPDGWQDLSVQMSLITKYWTISRKVTIPFKYVEDGAKILKHIFYKYGVEEPVNLVICEQQLDYEPGVGYKYWYKQIVNSSVDLSTFDHDGALVTAECEDEGIAAHLQANEGTVYEIPLNVPEAVTVKMDGINVKATANYIGVGSVSNNFNTNLHPLQIQFLSLDGINTGTAYLSQALENIAVLSTYISSSSNYFIENSTQIAITYRFSGAYAFKCTKNTIDAALRLDLYKTSTGTTGTPVYNSLTPLVSGQTYNVPLDVTFTLQPGEKAFLIENFYGTFAGGAIEVAIEYTDDAKFAVTSTSRFRSTFCKFLRGQYVFDQLIRKMTDNAYSAADCPYFTQFDNIVFTSGDGIRNIDGAVLKISFNDFMSFWNSFDEVGIKDIHGKVLMDRKANLIDFSNPIDLGEVANPKSGFDKSYPFNELAIGFPDQQNEQGILNGKNEFNTTFNFSLGTTRNPRKWDKTSKVKGGCYVIENLRVQFFLKDSTDNKNDNEAFAVHIEKFLTVGTDPDPDHYLLDRSLNPYITGVEEADSLFNVLFSPKRSLIRSGDFIRSSLYKFDYKTLKFLTADRNKDMAYLNGSNVLVESADVPIGDLAPAFFAPVPIKFDVVPPSNLLSIDPFTAFTWTINGDRYKGIVVDISINPQTSKPQTFTMLPTADTDLTPLIDYYGE